MPENTNNLSASQYQEKRMDRMETAISKLADVSSDVGRMLAVHEQQIGQQEKMLNNTNNNMEKHREEIDDKINSIYNNLSLTDKSIVEALEKNRKEISETHKKDNNELLEIIVKHHAHIDKKVNKIEKLIWSFLGGGAIILFIIEYHSYFSKLLS